MRPQWVFRKRSPHLPSWALSPASPFNNQIFRNPSPHVATFFLDHADICVLLSTCGKEGLLHLGPSIHASLIKKPEYSNPESRYIHRDAIFAWNSLLSMYWKHGEVGDAVKLFDNMPKRDTVSWNTVIAGFLRNGGFDMGFGYFKKMIGLGVCRFDQATLTTLLSGCDRQDFFGVCRMMHGFVFLNGYEGNITVGNALITSYFKCGCCGAGRQVFGEMFERNVITWTAVMSGLVQNELYEDSFRLFVEMNHGSVSPNKLTYLSVLMASSASQKLKEGCQIHGLIWKLGLQSDLCIESALMDMYSKCGRMNDAWQIFESAEEIDEVSLTVILVGFAQNGFEDEAIQIFVKIFKAGISIDPNMVSAILGVFCIDTSLGLGKQIHSLIIKRSYCSSPFVNNGLINMYSKCGELKESVKIFCRMPERNSISYNSMIAAFARHGDGCRALQLYEEMKSERLKPSDVTFLSLLHACSHVGLVEKGMELLESMIKEHGMSPRNEHYACIVDMLGRAGLLSEAKRFIEGLPEKPDILVWQALLGACSMHSHSEMGKYAADQLFLSAPKAPASYILLANIYSSEAKWTERAQTIKRMKAAGVAKETGISWIEIQKQVHSFVVDDKMHPRAETIREILAELFWPMIDEGYVPDKRFIRYYLDENEK